MLILPEKKKLWLPKKMGGYYEILGPDGEVVHRIKNGLVVYGATGFLQMVFQSATPFGATWYLGLTNQGYTFDGTTLAGLNAGEPAANGYARQAIARSGAGWTVSEVNGVMVAQSAVVTFTANANWDKQWQRMFLCDAANGTAGNVISVSGAAPALISVLSGAGPSMRYVYYLRG